MINVRLFLKTFILTYLNHLTQIKLNAGHILTCFKSFPPIHEYDDIKQQTIQRVNITYDKLSCARVPVHVYCIKRNARQVFYKNGSIQVLHVSFIL